MMHIIGKRKILMATKNKILYLFIKRAFDIFVSFVCLIILSPFMLIVGVLVAITSNGGPFYLDYRFGKNKKIIKIIKFRSMKKDSRPVSEILSPDEYKEYIKTYKLEHDPRVTKFGKFIRKTSIDELPQLFNILKGDISFVGPRPIAIKEYDDLWKNNDFIFKIKPGLTGYWAVNGRSDTTYIERIELERYYVMNRSIVLDIKIMFKTVIVVFSKKGAI